MAMGMVQPDAGAVELDGHVVTKMPMYKRARRGMGYAPEDSGIFPELTVGENLMIGRWLSEAGAKGRDGDDTVDARIRAVFPEVEELTARQGQNLSGGQKKMVAIARAMALSPSLLLLDEAFEGLAPVVVSRFTDAVIKIKEMGISLLIAESNLAHASGIADRMYAIDRGEIIFHGAPQDALGNDEVRKALWG
jgi:branched-chain amino acid transport system ATP-binding protein